MGAAGERAPRSIVPAVLLVAALALVHFFPFFLGRNMIPFHFLPSWESGLAGAKPFPPSAARLMVVRFPGTDESPVALHYPSAFFTGACLRSGRLPLWNPHVGCGLPALGCGQSYPFSPFLAPFYLHPTLWVYSLGLVLGTLFSAAGAWLWLRRFAFGPWVTAFAAGFWAFNPWTLRIVIFSSVWAAWWFGWLLWSWDAFLDAPLRRAWRPAVMVAGMVYCGHPEAAVLLAGASLLYAVLTWSFSAKATRTPPGTLLAGVALTVGLAGFLTAVHWLPVAAHFGESVSYKQALSDRPSGIHYELGDLFSPRTEVFVSPLLLGLATVGLAAARRQRLLWPSCLLLAASLLLVLDAGGLGTALGGVPFLGMVPLKYFRSLLWLSLVPLSAAGLSHLLDPGRAGKPGRLPSGAALALGVPLLWGLLYALSGYGRPRGLFAAALLTEGLLWVLLVAASWGGMRRALPVLATLAVVLVTVEPKALQPYSYFNGMDPVTDPKLPALERVLEETRQNHGRYHGDFPWPMTVTPNLASLWGARDVRANEVLLLERYARFNVACSPANQKYVGTWMALADLPPGLAAAMGVNARFAVGPRETPLVAMALPDPSARAFLVTRVRVAKDEQRSQALLTSGLASMDWRREAILEYPAPLPAPFKALESNGPTPPPLPGSVTWVADRPAEVVLEAVAPSPALLVLMDTYASGWRAAVDGAPARIYPADLAFRGVLLPAGRHVVRMVYRPWGVEAGLALSGAGWLALIGLVIAQRRRITVSSAAGAGDAR